MAQNDTFFVIQCDPAKTGEVVITVLHEVPDGATELGSFDNPGAAIDFAQDQARRLNSSGTAAQYVDPPDDLIGAG